ncbi:MAG: HEPN domain-containing protein [Spirochaetales bacterium]|nr:HEPN domain-containing protein [Spirochaetales bacterium]
MKKLAEEWLIHADKDIKTIEKIIDEQYLTNITAFHSHQCIEKSFKALILLKTGNVSKIHNLLKLYGTVRNYFPLDINIEQLQEINETYIDSRYPADLGLLPDGDLSSDKARQFYEETKAIYKQVVEIINTNHE